MRDPELMFDLLKEMSGDDLGRLPIPMTFDMGEQAQQRRQHVELLVDAGHAEWVNDDHDIARITNAGYDFLNAATNPANGKEAKTKYVDLFNGGASYARATQSVVDWVSKLAGA